MNIIVDTARPGISYPTKNAVFNFPLELHARKIGSNALWTPGVSLDQTIVFDPVFRGSKDQLYTIELKTPTGCITVDTQLVRTYKKIEIYVPSVFTPNNDGQNDYLRPLMMGFDKLIYFLIYNRLGKLLFETETDRPGWDGKYKTQDQTPQTLVWLLEAVDMDGKVHTRKGTTLLIN